MDIQETALPGVLIIAPRKHADARGHFVETWNRSNLAAVGVEIDFVQDNASFSVRPATLRGLHCQLPPFAQAKLVRCVRGRILDVAVDIRRSSANYGQWVGVELDSTSGRQLLIPAGFLHGFVTREPDTEVAYKCSAPYSAQYDRAVRFDDPGLGIDWGIAPEAAILSEKDRAARMLEMLDNTF